MFSSYENLLRNIYLEATNETNKIFIQFNICVDITNSTWQRFLSSAYESSSPIVERKFYGLNSMTSSEKLNFSMRAENIWSSSITISYSKSFFFGEEISGEISSILCFVSRNLNTSTLWRRPWHLRLFPKGCRNSQIVDILDQSVAPDA